MFYHCYSLQSKPFLSFANVLPSVAHWNTLSEELEKPLSAVASGVKVLL